METVNEGTNATLTITFRDENGALITPSAATYVVYDKFSGTEIRTGSISPLGTSIAFSLSSSDNIIQNIKNRYEIRVVYVEFYYNFKTGSGEYSYKVQNLAKIP